MVRWIDRLLGRNREDLVKMKIFTFCFRKVCTPFIQTEKK